ncbi:ATPase domain-containing protein [Marinobacter sp. SS13-12]|uniref:ATPase domain-containing protein n=1 Tax=Marinobacter sp. SS13-12 TaxID=3050451 RepID=UPI002553AFB7|nr:ATPase domain-containing protein [Marinobacter sp. SS13-12]MDK8462222.1 gas vesicle protein GvpD [Marinobacter sp. SS13-12]
MNNPKNERLTSGITGFDRVLNGGLLQQRSYIVRGGPGSGKTTLGLHFLTAAPGARSLFVSMGEDESQLRADAHRQGFNLDKVSIVDFSTSGSGMDDAEPYSIMATEDVEDPGLPKRIRKAFEAVRPTRIFIDSLTYLQYFSPDAFQYRKQVITLLRFLTNQGATVICAAEDANSGKDSEALAFLADGVIQLDHRDDKRSLEVTKFRGSGFTSGPHSIRLGSGGMRCFPRLEPGDHGIAFDQVDMPFGIPELDRQLKGGLSRGTVTILSGPTGVGKTSLGIQFMKNACEEGKRTVVYTFEELTSTLSSRVEGINLSLSPLLETGSFAIEAIEPLYYSADEFAAKVREEVEERGTRIIMIDSLAGYRLSIGGDNVTRRLHALCRYLVNMGVTVILLNEVEAITGGEVKTTEMGVSYLADTIILLRYMERAGEIRKTIGVLKKRTGDFEKSLREFDITPNGIRVGSELTGLRGILRGEPEPEATTSIENARA